MVRDDVPGAGEPEGRETGEDAPLVGDLRRQDDVEGRDAVGGDEQQPLVVERVQLAHLAAADVQGVRHAPSPAPRRAPEALEHGVDVRGVGIEREHRVEGDASREVARRARTSSRKSSSSSQARIA